jgi:hypothetical protein
MTHTPISNEPNREIGADAVPDSVPDGTSAPWVLVIGMHRSGTSALTGAIAALGLTLPPPWDLVTGKHDNPSHFESASLITTNDTLLESLGGTWWAPPDLSPGWESGPGGKEFETEARNAIDRVFSGPGPNVWKDPRNCLLLPFWRRVLPGPKVAVFVWRSPMDVAKSLQQRGGTSLPHGLALWERYNRAALAGIEGLPSYVTSSEALLEDPHSICQDIATWLDECGIRAPAPGIWDVDAAAQVVSPQLVHHRSDDTGLLPASQLDLVEDLRALNGSQSTLRPLALGVMSPWSIEVLAARRELTVTESQLRMTGEASAEIATVHQGLIKTYHELVDVCDERLVRIIELQEEVALLRSTIDDKDSIEATVREQLETAHERLEAMGRERDEWSERALSLSDELEKLRSSRSWRVTAPMRSIVDAAHKRDDAGAS